jgi:hypothetical protein
MALERVGLSISTTNNSTCNGLTFEDTTGTYNVTSNPDGYGLPEGIVSNDITSATIVLTNQSDNTYITFVFTVSSGTITAATLSVQGGTATSILSELSSTVFPFVTANAFDMSADYGVTVPEITDGLYQTEYTVSGTSTGGGALPSQTFSYTTSIQELVYCATKCCITKMFANIDPNCGCAADAIVKANRADGYLKIAISAAEYGKIDEAVAALNKATELCDCGCGC